jgi:hypothetical protein
MITRRAVIAGLDAPLLATHAQAQPATTRLFTAYNIWYEDPNRVSSGNYKTGSMVPAGTAVRSVGVKHEKIAFVTAEGARYTVIFESAKHPGMTIDEFKDRMLIPRNFAEMTREMTAVEVGCIREGAIGPDLGKQAVLMAYGYPPEDRTPSVNGNIWRYPISRSQIETIRFDENGMTTGNDPTGAE